MKINQQYMISRVVVCVFVIISRKSLRNSANVILWLLTMLLIPVAYLETKSPHHTLLVQSLPLTLMRTWSAEMLEVV